MKIFFLVVVLCIVSVFQCNALLGSLLGGGGGEEGGGGGGLLGGLLSPVTGLLGGLLGKK